MRRYPALLLILLLFLLAPGLGAAAQATLALQWQPLREPGNGGFMVSIAVSPHDPNRVIVGGDMLGVALSTDGGENWGGGFGLDSWEMGDITYHPTDPNLVWIGSMSGPYRSTDGGLNWASQRNGMGAFQYFYSVPIQKILFDPRNSQTLYAFGGSKREWDANVGAPDWGSIWRSTDSGATWVRLGRVGSGARPGIHTAAFSGEALYALADGQVWRSLDFGLNWQAVNTGLPTPYTARWIEPDPRQPGTLYLATFARQVGNGWQPGGLFRTIDGGLNWAALPTAGLEQSAQGENLTSAYWTIRVSPTGVLYTADWAWNVSAIFRLRPGATSWEKLAGYDPGLRPATAYPAGAGAFDIALDPRNEQRLFTINTEYTLRSVNGGASWTDASSFQPDPARPQFWRGRGYSGLVATNLVFNPFHEQAVILGMDAGKFWQSSDRFQSWSRGNISNWGGGNDASFSGPGGNTIYLGAGQFGTYDGIWKSTDGGQSWARVTQPPGSSREAWGIYAHPTSNQVWAVVGTRLYASGDGGGSWSLVTSNGIQDDGGLRWIVPHINQPLTFYVSGARGVWQTSDGLTFNLMPGSPGPVHRLATDPSTPGRLYATRWRTPSTNGLYRFDSGAWTLVRQDYALAHVAVHPRNPAYLSVTTDDHPFHDDSDATGVWLSTDGGTNWTQQNSGLPMLRGAVIRFNPYQPDQLLLGTTGRGYFIASWPVAPPLIGDINGDGAVTLADFALLAAAFNQREGEPDYNPGADLNADRAVTLADFALLASNFNRTRGTS